MPDEIAAWCITMQAPSIRYALMESCYSGPRIDMASIRDVGKYPTMHECMRSVRISM